MISKLRKNVKKALAFAVVLTQVAACGVIAPAMSVSAANTSATARKMENLSRGVVAMKTSDGVFISWRRMATEAADTQFTLYRNQVKVTEGAITNYVDKDGSVGDKYTVVANGTMSKPASVWEDNYLDIPLADPPESDVMLTDRNGYYFGSYTPGDSTYADVDGDGDYEIIMMWNPANALDAATTGQTDKVFIDCYKLDGTQLWRIDMGYNIRAGQHDTMLMAADFNLDGKAELILRTADGTTDSKGNMVGDAEKGSSYENSWAALNSGKNLQGPLYVTAFNGETGEIIDTTDFYPSNTPGSTAVSYTFGDDFGNRSERYNGTVAYIDGVKPSAVFGRGYYGGKNTSAGRCAVAVYSLENNKLKMNWKFDTEDSGNDVYIGQGNHQIEAGDVDGDGKDEIFLGAITWDDDGSVLWCTGYGHGDAMHLGDFDPTKEGLEFMKVHEEGAHAYNTELKGDTALGAEGTDQIYGMVVQNAKTGEIYQTHNGVKDTGRGMIGNIGYKDSYYVTWAAGSTGYWDNEGNALPDLGASMNGRIYWDGDLQDELQDHVTLTKWNDTTGKFDTILDASADCYSINGTKGNVNAQGDLLGDWREEFVTYTILDQNTVEQKLTINGDPEDPTVDNTTPSKIDVTVKKTSYKYGLRLYTTNIPTDYNFYTLAHDDIYRNSSGAYGNCYNQPPHISWYMNDKIAGSTYTTQPSTNITLVANSYKEDAFDESKLPEGGGTTVVAPGPVVTTDTPFTDISGHWGETYITEMYKAGVINGETETTFNPDGTITKGEFIKLISASLQLELADAKDGDHWAVPYVDAAKAAGLVNEAITLDNLDEQITREQMASIVAKAAEYKGVDASGGSVDAFTDASSISEWAKDDVAAAVKTGVVKGNEDGTFAPTATATRAEAATMMSRLLAL